MDKKTINLDIFNDITAFAYLDNGDKIDLELKDYCEDSAFFYSSKLNINFTVSIKEYMSGKILTFSGDYSSQNTGIYLANHFGLEAAIGIHIGSIDCIKKYMATVRENERWSAPYFGEDISNMENNTQAILGLNEEDNYLFIIALCDNIFKTNICGDKTSGMDILVWSNDYRNSVDTTAIYYSLGDQPYDLSEKSVGECLALLNRPVNLRKDRKYNEVFEYLGWCSWDAFHMSVTHDGLIKKAQEFKTKGIPVRWMLLDDMWGDAPNNDLKTMSSRELDSFEAAPDRFSNGLKGIVSELKQLDMKVGLWHPTIGYWHGINPDSRLAKEYHDLLFYSQELGCLIHSFEKDKLSKYYDLQHEFYNNCGVDFIKVDNQSCLRKFAKLVQPIGTAAENLHFAIEKVANKYYDGALINCMGMAIENFWHRENSSICRFCCDFKPESRQWFNKHLIQCSYNSIVHGAIYVGDWDMWWSNDSQAGPNALIHAMSGGPIYLSDELGKSVKDTIMPIIYSDGRIIRLNTPAKPTIDNLFVNPAKSQEAFKIFNQHNDCGILASFNMSDSNTPESTEICPKDMLLEESKSYCVYDWRKSEAIELSGEESFCVSIENFDDYKLYLFVPIINDIAVIGLSKKYMSVATYDFTDNVLKVFDDGEVVVFCKNDLYINNKPLKKYKENLYKFNALKDTEYLLTCPNKKC